MPVEPSWFDEARTIRYWKVTGAWTWEEYLRTIDASAPTVAEQPHRVDVIVDLTEADPPGPQLIERLRDLQRARKRLPNVALTVLVGRGHPEATMMVLEDLAPDVRPDYRHAVTLDQALAIIAQDRAASRP